MNESLKSPTKKKALSVVVKFVVIGICVFGSTALMVMCGTIRLSNSVVLSFEALMVLARVPWREYCCISFMVVDDCRADNERLLSKSMNDVLEGKMRLTSISPDETPVKTPVGAWFW